MYDILGLRSAAARQELTSVATPYAEATNRMEFPDGVRFLDLDIAGSAAVYLYVYASPSLLTDAEAIAALGDATRRQRVLMKTKANGGVQTRVAFNADAKYVYFITESGTADVAAAGYRT
jgi:hypothetical protein